MHALALFSRLPLFNAVHFVFADPEVGSLADGFPVNAIHNAWPERGGCESVRLGVSASAADHYLFAPCDQPLLDAFSPPAFRRELLELADGQMPRTIKGGYPEKVIPVSIDKDDLPRDVDTAEDLSLLERIAGKNGK